MKHPDMPGYGPKDNPYDEERCGHCGEVRYLGHKYRGKRLCDDCYGAACDYESDRAEDARLEEWMNKED